MSYFGDEKEDRRLQRLTTRKDVAATKAALQRNYLADLKRLQTDHDQEIARVHEERRAEKEALRREREEHLRAYKARADVILKRYVNGIRDALDVSGSSMTPTDRVRIEYMIRTLPPEYQHQIASQPDESDDEDDATRVTLPDEDEEL
jgi:hypothetical protein